MTDLLAPFIPLGLLVAALVSLVRSRLAKVGVNLNGWAVIGLAALATVAVCLWTQQRHLGAFDWKRLLVDAPAVLVLAVGGTAWVEQMKGGVVVSAPAPTTVKAGSDDDEEAPPAVSSASSET